ncbi:hypothetical protein EGR_04536 [Echinococcus granulosus]|uniref:Uncharacterized protein n=1 Tax=Echinococcus granulosus TaxID=6210 RepID=W6UI26_ECHGR|nr:hypothetical protein EGR_04536 [Echinococcus granulosus]EUB60703.1 hypothetical protein EGR_04536 [Echinococcus granulosus]
MISDAKKMKLEDEEERSRMAVKNVLVDCIYTTQGKVESEESGFPLARLLQRLPKRTQHQSCDKWGLRESAIEFAESEVVSAWVTTQQCNEGIRPRENVVFDADTVFTTAFSHRKRVCLHLRILQKRNVSPPCKMGERTLSSTYHFTHHETRSTLLCNALLVTLSTLTSQPIILIASFNMYLRCSPFTVTSTSPLTRCCTSPPPPPPPLSSNRQPTQDASHSTLPLHTL